MQDQQNAQRRTDVLLESLVFITGFFGHMRSSTALSAGLPVGAEGMSPRLFCQAADRAGFKAKPVRRPLADIPAEVLPVVAVLQGRRALVLIRREGKDFLVFDPETRTERTESVEAVAAVYSGHCLYIKPDHSLEDTEAVAMRTHWFWGNVVDNAGLYARVLVAALLVNIFALTSPIFTMNFYDRVLPNNAVETGWVLAIGAVSIFVFDFIIRTLRAYFIDLAGRRADVILGQKLFNQVLDMRLGARGGSIGSFANSLREFDALREFFNSATMTGIVDFPFSLLFVGVIWMIGGIELAALLVLFYLLVMCVGYIMQLPVRRKVVVAMKTGDQKHGLLVEAIANLETIKGVGGEGRIRDAYAHYVSRAAEAGQASRFYSGMSVNFSTFIQMIATIAIMLVGMYKVEAREMTIGALMACVILTSRAIAPIGQVATLVNRFHQARAAYNTLDKIMRQPVERPRDKKFLHRPVLDGDFQFKGVSFAYPGTPYPVLSNVNLKINKGEKVAIVGRIGSGKTTLVKLLVDFYQPTDGGVFVDGTDMRQIDPADLRRNVAYMGQDTLLMSGTIRDNIVMGRPRASDEDVLKIAEIAGVHEFVRRHPMGYDAHVGERGEGLSGGQRQSVALARTLIMDTPVLVLDEPTNAMDTGSEDLILRNLEAFVKDKTLVLVTHKPALLKLVTRLVVMEGGRVVMDGPRDVVLQALSSGKVTVPAG